jgi:hypothetical protein
MPFFQLEHSIFELSIRNWKQPQRDNRFLLTTALATTKGLRQALQLSALLVSDSDKHSRKECNEVAVPHSESYFQIATSGSLLPVVMPFCGMCKYYLQPSR